MANHDDLFLMIINVCRRSTVETACPAASLLNGRTGPWGESWVESYDQRCVRGDVKKLTNHTPEYRLRVGDYRVLFEIDGTDRVSVYRIMHRREAYR